VTVLIYDDGCQVGISQLATLDNILSVVPANVVESMACRALHCKIYCHTAWD